MGFPSLAPLVLEAGLVSSDALKPYLDHSDFSLFQVLKERFSFSDDVLLPLLASKLGLVYQQFEDLSPDPEALALFSDDFLESMRFVPLFKEGDELGVVLDNPYNPVLSSLQDQNLHVSCVILVPSSQLLRYFSSSGHSSFDEQVVVGLVHEASGRGASDIHVCRRHSGVDVFFRQDGELVWVRSFDEAQAVQLYSVLKLKANLDVSQSYIPQDGRLSFEAFGKRFDCRLSTLPTVYGEDAVIRLFRDHESVLSFEELGFLDRPRQMLETMLGYSSGLVLVSGPTGSGKTTTLYSCLDYVKSYHNRLIVTLEDPVEMVLDGVRQSQINDGIGYGFVEGLRSVLRQDPDVIMVGEIRDVDAAQIALQAAYTGHLVLATLHTSCVEEALLRLESFGLDPFLVGHSLRGIVCQRLERRVCSSCGVDTGCDVCHFTGIEGRVVVNEMVHFPSGVKVGSSGAFVSQLLEGGEHYSFDEDIVAKRSLHVIR